MTKACNYLVYGLPYNNDVRIKQKEPFALLLSCCYNYKIIKLDWTKRKRIIWIASAVLFLVVLFLLKTGFIFKTIETYQANNQNNGLVEDNTTVADLVNKDSNGNGIPDWQESLYGLDPTKKATADGTLNSDVIAKLRAEQSVSTINGSTTTTQQEKLTETEKFSRELFATVSAASQNGTMDQATIDALGASLAERVQNSPQRKIFSISDIKVINNDTAAAFTNYSSALNNIYIKYSTTDYGVLNALQDFMADPNNVNSKALVKLTTIIKQTTKIIGEMQKIEVPQSISTLHLNILNSEEALVENLSDIQLYDTDPILSLGGITKYKENATKLQSTLNDLTNAINKKLP